MDRLKRHPVIAYYLLTFSISWGGVLLLIGGPGAIPGHPEETARSLPLFVGLLVLGPAVAGILMTTLVHGMQGLRELIARAVAWRARPRWYAIALLTTPLMAALLLFVLSRSSPIYIPGFLAANDKAALWSSALLAGLVAGLFEELGWTGFAIPQLRKRHDALATGLISGFLWGVWHYIAAFWGSGDATGTFFLELLAPPMVFYVVVLPAYRVLMVFLYERTRSLLLAMLMHASLTANTIFLFMPVATGYALAGYHLALGLAFWCLVLAWERGFPKNEH